MCAYVTVNKRFCLSVCSVASKRVGQQQLPKLRKFHVSVNCAANNVILRFVSQVVSLHFQSFLCCIVNRSVPWLLLSNGKRCSSVRVWLLDERAVLIRGLLALHVTSHQQFRFPV
jgi:hypothetical protein